MTAALALVIMRRLAIDRHDASMHDTLNFDVCEYGGCEDAREALRILEERVAAR